MNYSEFSKALLLHPGIVRIEALSDEIVEDLKGIEYSPSNVGFTPIDPIGLSEIFCKRTRLILFCSNEFRMFTEPFMNIIDDRGNLIGHDVLPSEKHLYDSKCYIWLAENLFVDASLMTGYGIRTVIHSLPLQVEGIPDETNPRIFYPSVTSANYLNKRFDITGKIVATILLGADI